MMAMNKLLTNFDKKLVYRVDMSFWKKNRRVLAVLMIVIGSLTIIYTQDDVSKYMYVLAIGIALLMFGLYTIASGVSPKKMEEHSYIQSDDEE